jgi:hypothetical protein
MELELHLSMSLRKLQMELGHQGAPFSFIKLQNFDVKISKFQKNKYVDIVNDALYHCVNFQNKIHYILGSVKRQIELSVYQQQNLSLSLLLNPKFKHIYFIRKIDTWVEYNICLCPHIVL